MTRPPSGPNEEAAQGQTKPPGSAAPTKRAYKKGDVAAFIIPEMPIPWDSVIDVRSAKRLQIAGFDPPLFVPPPPLPEPLAVPAADTPATELISLPVTDGVSDLVLNAETPGVTTAPGLDLERLVGGADDAIEASPFDARSTLSPPQQEASQRRWAAMSAMAAGSASRLWAKSMDSVAKWRTAAGRKADAARADVVHWSRGVARRSGAVIAGLSTATRARVVAAWPRLQAGRERIGAVMTGLSTATRARVVAAWPRVQAGRARIGAAIAGLSTATRARAVAAWPRVQAGQQRLTARMSHRVAVWRPRAGRLATACASTTIRAAAGTRASLALLPAAIADVAVRNRRHLRLTGLATASVLLVFGAARLLQLAVPLTDVTRSTGASVRLAATPLAGVAALAPAIVQRAATIEPEVRDEPIQPAVERVVAPRPPAAFAPRRAALTASAVSLPPPATADAVRADLSSAPPERPREALVPAPFPTPREDAARASRTDEPRIDLSPPPAERGRDRPVPAPFPMPRSDAPRSDRADLAANDGIAEALKHLELAYGRRDARLAKAVWPTVNERALARAFDGLRSQSVTFDRCKMDVAGAAGDVECHGITTYVTRVGSQDRRTESRQWKFRVKKDDDSWLIVSASAR